MIKKFRKKPVTIEAIRLLNNDDSIEECIEWVFKIGMETSLIGKAITINDVKDKGGFYIPTLEGDMKANIGDYIIKGVNGEFYPCKPDIFTKTYEEDINNMKIQEMIEAIKNGKKVRRECWSEDKFLYYVPSASYPARTGIENSIADKDGKVLYKEYIAIRCKDGDVGFYTPTQCDILAEDWKVIVE